MINFMENAACEQLCTRNFNWITMAILAFGRYIQSAKYIAAKSGDTQATFRPRLFTAGNNNFWIDHFNQSTVFLSAIHDDNAFKNADLRGSKTYALSFIHRVCHIIEQFMQIGIKFR